MMAAGLSLRSRISVAVGCLALVMTIALEAPTVAAGQEHEQGRVPSKLWKAYPFDLSEQTERTRIGHGDGQKTITPSVATTTPVGTEIVEPERQSSSRVEPSRTFSVALLALALLALLVIVALSATRQAALRRPPGRTSTQTPFMPTKKGPRMPKPKRRPRKRDVKPPSLEPSSGHHRDERSNAAPTPIDASGSRGNENDPEPSEIRSEAPVDSGNGEDANHGEVAQTDELKAVAEEVQTVLASAKQAAENIRRKAEEDAERLRRESASAVEAELAEARRIAESERAEAERARAEAATFAAETRAAAESSAEETRTASEREAGRIAEEAQRRLDEADNKVAERFGQAESEAAERVEKLHAEIRRHEQRLESILFILGGMTSQLEDLLGHAAARDQGAEPPAESLEDVLRPERSTQSG
jgi:hypothetical protein